MTHTITLSPELYQHLQDLKLMIKEITNQEVASDEDAISLLIGGFFDSIERAQQEDEEGEGEGEHDHHGHHHHGHHHHGHHHHGDKWCGSDGCGCKH